MQTTWIIQFVGIKQIISLRYKYVTVIYNRGAVPEC